VKIVGFVNCPDDYAEQPEVLNGCSNMLGEVFGMERGQHARSAVGTNSLPRQVPRQLARGAFWWCDLTGCLPARRTQSRGERGVCHREECSVAHADAPRTINRLTARCAAQVPVEIEMIAEIED
jgi:enamine deaminase RidA (YjgF/YER057c/UK114 family)